MNTNVSDSVYVADAVSGGADSVTVNAWFHVNLFAPANQTAALDVLVYFYFDAYAGGGRGQWLLSGISIEHYKITTDKNRVTDLYTDLNNTSGFTAYADTYKPYSLTYNGTYVDSGTGETRGSVTAVLTTIP